MQKEILERHPGLGIRVYAVWFSMLGTDRRDRWPRDALTDPRVTHLWDEGKVAGREYAKLFDSPGQVAWDMFVLYPEGVGSLRNNDGIQAWGAPLYDRREELARGVASLAEGGG